MGSKYETKCIVFEAAFNYLKSVFVYFLPFSLLYIPVNNENKNIFNRKEFPATKQAPNFCIISAKNDLLLFEERFF